MNWHTATPAERAADWTLLANGDLRENRTGEVWSCDRPYGDGTWRTVQPVEHKILTGTEEGGGNA